MRLHTGLGRKTRSSSRLRLGWLAFFGFLLSVWGFLGNLDDVNDVWDRLTVWVLHAAHLRGDLVPYPKLLTLAAFLLPVTILFLILRDVSDRGDRKEANARGVSLRALLEERARKAYLDYLSDDLENRLSSSIHDACFIDIGLEETPGATLPWHYVSYPLQGTATSFSSVDQAFAHFRGRLLILGAPGSGKTTSMLHIGRRILTEAQRDPHAATPVLLNLSSFEESKPMLSWLTSMFSLWKSRPLPDPTLAFDQWLIQELSRLPFPGEHLAQRWVKEGNLALLLDGLDEIQEDRRPAVVAAINQSTLLSFPSLPLVVCSRSLDYTQLVDSGSSRLTLRGAVTLQPLTHDQIELYLSSAHASELRNALSVDPGLRELAQTPLTLSMMTISYVGPTPTQAPESSSLIERRGSLFEHYIDRMMQRHARRRVGKPFDLNADLDEPTEYSRSEVDTYLGWLATRMSELSRTSFPPGELMSFLGPDAQSGAASFRAPFLSERRLGRLGFALLGTGVIVMAFSTLGPRHLSLWVQLASFFGGTVAFLTAEVVGWRLMNYLMNYQAIAHGSPSGVLVSTGLAVIRTLGFSFVTSLALLIFLWLVLFSSVVVLLPIPSTISAVGVLLAVLYWFRMTGPSIGAGERASAIVPFIAACLFGVTANLQGHSDIMWWSLVLAGCLGAGISVARTLFRVGWVAAVASALFLGSVIATGSLATHAFSQLSLEVSVFATSLSFGLLSAMSAGTAVGLAAGAVVGLLVAAAPGAIAGAAFCAKACRGHLRQPLNRWVDLRLLNPCVLAVLVSGRRLPVRLTRFLEYASDVLLLHRSGGDYEFVHRLLRDHFALRSLTPRIFEGTGRNGPAVVAKIALLGDTSLAVLSEFATHPDPAIREAAVVGLGDLRLPQAAPLLKRILSSEGLASVRCRTVESLGKTPLEEGRDAWELSFRDPAPDVRSAAAKALGRVKPAELVKERYLLELLQGALRDPSEQVVRAAIETLGNDELILEVMEAPIDQLEETLASGGPLALDLFYAPARVLGLRTDKDSQRHSGRIRDQARELLRGDDANERSSAARVLGILKDNDSLETLLAATGDDNDSYVRRAAAFAVGDLASVEAVPRLLEILKHEANTVRAAAAESVGKVLANKARAGELSEEARDAIEEALIRSLSSQRRRVWIPAAKALKESPSRRTASALLRSLTWLSKEGQDVAMDSLSGMGQFIDPEDLLNLLGTQRLRIRYGVARLLADQPSTEKLLLSWLERGEPSVRVGAALSLGAMRSANAIPALVSIIRESGSDAPDALFGYFGRDGMAPDEAASYALVLIGSPAVPQLAELLRESGASPLGLVAEMLARIATPSAERELRRFRSSGAESRATIQEALGTLKQHRKLVHRVRGESRSTIFIETIMSARLVRIEGEGSG
jgi:HEAT repeat protein/Cdc6-like AAA superfamily ATPase